MNTEEAIKWLVILRSALQNVKDASGDGDFEIALYDIAFLDGKYSIEEEIEALDFAIKEFT